MYYLITFYLLFNEVAYARSIRASANKFAQELNQLGMVIGLVGLIWAGYRFIAGKQDAAEKFTLTFAGILIVACSSSLLDFIRGLA